MPALARQQCDGMPPLCSWCPPRLVEELSPVLRACLQALLDFFLCLKVFPLDPTAMGLPASRLPPPRCFAGRFPESLPCPSPGGCPPNLEERLPQNFRHCTAPRPPDIGRSEHLWWLVLWRCGCFPLVAAFSCVPATSVPRRVEKWEDWSWQLKRYVGLYKPRAKLLMDDVEGSNPNDR